MKDIRSGLGFGLFVTASVCLFWPLGCDQQFGNQQTKSAYQLQYEKDYQEQLELTKKQNADWERQSKDAQETDAKYKVLITEWERQTKKADEDAARYDALMTKWEEQTQRADALMDKWDVILSALEKREGDSPQTDR